MISKERHFVGEVGTVVYVNCEEDVSTAVNASVYLKRPCHTILQKIATPVVYKGSPNYVRFIVEEGDFNRPGDYYGQVHLTLGNWTGKGSEFIIDVEEGFSSSSSRSSSSRSSSSSSRSSSSSSLSSSSSSSLSSSSCSSSSSLSSSCSSKSSSSSSSICSCSSSSSRSSKSVMQGDDD